MKLKNILLYLLPIAGLCSSCNDEWENEQFTHYISFKAPINSDGVSRINVRYRSGNEKTTFQLPIIVSGSTTNERNITVHVGLDTDTLKVLNQERFVPTCTIKYCQKNSTLIQKRCRSMPGKM